jgi:anti-sigma regulatory factor (Ser/Thr protein kinase)
MAYTIARSAGKRATSGSPILMPTDSDHAASGSQGSQAGRMAPSVQIVIALHNDPRLLIGAGVIAGHAAQHAGLTEPAQEHLATATTEACGEMFALARPDQKSPPVVNVTASRFPDRVEITVELSIGPTSPKASSRSKKATARGGKQSGKLLDERLVDQVQRETRDGRPSIVLVKYCRPVKSKA